MDFKKILGKFTDREASPSSATDTPSDDLVLDSAPPAAPPPGRDAQAVPITPRLPQKNPDSTGIAGLSASRHSAETQLQNFNKAGLVQNEVNDSAYLQRAEQVQAIEAMFGEYGPAVSSFLLTQSLMPGGVGRVVQKLGMSSRGRDGADLAQINGWLGKHGVDAFCEKVRIRQRTSRGSGEVTPPPTDGEKLPEGKTYRTRGQLKTSDTQNQPAPSHLQSVDVEGVSLTGEPRKVVEPPMAPDAPPPPPKPAEPQRPQPVPPTEKRGFMFAPKAKEE